MGFYGKTGPNMLQRVDLSFAVQETSLLAEQAGLIGMEIAPAVTVRGDNGKYPVVKESQINQKLVSDERQPGGRFNRIDVVGETGSYTTAYYGNEAALDRQQAAIYADDFDQEVLTAEALEVNALKNYEKRVITLAEAAPAAATSLSAVWTSAASTPVTDMIKIKLELRAKRRIVPNALLRLVLDYEVVELLRVNDEIRDTLSQQVSKLPDELDNDYLARALGVGKLLVANSFENKSNPGTADADVDMDLQWDVTKGFLCIASKKKTQGYRWCNTLFWGGGINGWEQYYQAEIDADVLRYRKAYGLHVVDSASALLISGVKA